MAQLSQFRRSIFLVLLLLVASGCATHQELRKHVVPASLTAEELYYQQVLDNVARFTANRGMMPSFCMVSGTANHAMDFRATSPIPDDRSAADPTAQGNSNFHLESANTWSAVPVNHPNSIRRMRSAFQCVVGACDYDGDRRKEDLEGFVAGSDESYDWLLPTGWYHVGERDDVPCDACYVGHYCDTYVWVMPEGMDGFTRFTITIFDIAAEGSHAPQRTTIKAYRGKPESENLETIDVTSTKTYLMHLEPVASPITEDLLR